MQVYWLDRKPGMYPCPSAVYRAIVVYGTKCYSKDFSFDVLIVFGVVRLRWEQGSLVPCGAELLQKQSV